MAYSDEDTLREVLRGLSYREYTPKTINNEADYLKELEKVRNQGYGEDLCEHEENICCLAAPIRDRFGNVVAGMSITWPEFRFSEDEKDTYLEWIMETANAISKDLGYIA
jgi:IclR family KDG regulon transcriptional repressor